ncbi:uncharacterized protein JN550_004290 [Neoarthrinium moseri]|uniref:uncharacterized protein n=1 Tax=Neoarthrinium moseri TaxID=1658444 RepID=UPI001FDB6423|nr:uncharacterized protein JN550_004290 [Neoarthrinium moseri]KAI1872087.1 hypothetical protein JN550_004290 [Neoarthrinium moseri]
MVNKFLVTAALLASAALANPIPGNNVEALKERGDSVDIREPWDGHCHHSWDDDASSQIHLRDDGTEIFVRRDDVKDDHFKGGDYGHGGYGGKGGHEGYGHGGYGDKGDHKGYGGWGEGHEGKDDGKGKVEARDGYHHDHDDHHHHDGYHHDHNDHHGYGGNHGWDKREAEAYNGDDKHYGGDRGGHHGNGDGHRGDRDGHRGDRDGHRGGHGGSGRHNGHGRD